MNKQITLNQLKKLINESVSDVPFTSPSINLTERYKNLQESDVGWTHCVNAVADAVEAGEMTWEEVAREALLYMTEDNIVDMADKNNWDIGFYEDENDSIDITDGIPSEDDEITESEDGNIRSELQELIDNGKLSWEELAGGLCDYLKDGELREIANANGWLSSNEDVQIIDEKSSFGDEDEDDYVYELDPSGELDLNGNPKMIKRAKGFGDDWERVKGRVKGWFGRR